MPLSDAQVRALKAPPNGQKVYGDDSLPGFGCRVSQGGTKTFVVTIGRDRRKVTIGRYGAVTLAQARVEAKRILAEHTLGKVRPQSISYPQAVELFLDDKAKARRPATVADYKRRLGRLNFKGPVGDITHAEAARKLDKFKAPSERSHILVAGKVFFQWCMKRRYISQNPLYGLSKPKQVSRKRVLSDDELRRIWAATSEPTKPNKLVRLLMVTGQRVGEVEQWLPAFLEDKLLTIPETITKNSVEQWLPVGPLTHSLLTFPGKFTNWGIYKAELDKLTAINEPWMIRDLRRTFRTGLSKLGVAPHVAERLMHHISAADPIAQVYDKYRYVEEMREAALKWEQHVISVVQKESPPTSRIRC
jgi:integrase